VAQRRKRRVWSEDEKRTICAQTRVPGVSVSQVARRYDVNANLVFKWLREGWLPADSVVEEAACFLPVEIVGKASPAEPMIEGSADNRIEIELAGGHNLKISGTYDPDALARLIRGLSA
jgi:transposase